MSITLFYSYAHVDEPLRQQLEKHLSLLQRQGLILPWHDRAILPGDEWAKDIDEHLNTASIILLLISPDFLASDYCFDKEMQRAVERHTRDEARVIPIILRPCDWHSAPFGKLQAVPRDGKAITTWQNQDEAFLAVATELRRVIERFTGPQLAPMDERNRTILLKRVRHIWIEGLLEQSLHKAAWIELNLQVQPDAIENPWRLHVQELGQAPRSLAAGTSLVQMYDKADGQLLLLGEPGAGKTTLLLELTHTLLERAERDSHLPVPVVFTLSTWADKRLPLSDWMLEELKTRYEVSRKIGMTLLATDQILPLLDGLDEVAGNIRAACAQAITVYSQEHIDRGPRPLVVCCRSKEYNDLSTHVSLQQAVGILPLSQEQIGQYLQSAGKQVDALRQALQDDAELNELVRQPLMLSIFTLAYQDATFAELLEETTREKTHRAVFAHYVERMLTRRGHLKQWTPKQVKHFLAFLAAQMRKKNMTIFSVEGLQPDWLPANRRRLYQLLVGLVFGLVFGLLVEQLVGLVFRLVGELVFRLVGGLSVVLSIGLVVGLVFGLLAVKIEPMEILTWSWKRFRSREIIVLSTGLVVGSVFGLVGELVGVLVGVLLVGLVGVLVGVLLVVLESGFSGKQLIERSSLSPNEGIWRSGRSGLVGGLVSGLVGGLLSVLVVVLSVVLNVGLSGVLVGGLSVLMLVGLRVVLSIVLNVVLSIVLSVGLSVGLLAFVQHFILRFWLWRWGYLPWNLVLFLDEAAKRLLLRKVGGSYIFVHRQLLDYFASLEHIDA